MDIGLAQELFRMEAARARGETVSEFKVARLYTDSLWVELHEMLESGVAKADVVGVLAIVARVSRSAAYNTISNKMNSEENRKRKVKNDAPNQASKKQVATPTATKPAKSFAVDIAAPGTPSSMSHPAPAPPTSACTELKQEQPGFSVGIKIGSNFAGVDDVGRQAEQEREARQKSLANLESMEKKYGSPDKFK